jgi:hypothetical protein
MKIRKNYSCNTSFLDLLFNMLLAFACLFVLAFALINQNKKTPDVKASYLITFTWPKELDNDVDAYVEDPEGNLVCFVRREDGLMHLDRDDLGYKNDTINTRFGKITYNENKEIITLRGTTVGEYCVNIHAYNFNHQVPTEVTVQLEKVSPTYSVLVQRKITLNKVGDEKTAFRFKINSKGDLESVSDLEKKLLGIRNKQGQQPANVPIIPPETP